MSVIGFTGRRDGLVQSQRQALQSVLRHPANQTVHHGDCIGADAEIHSICVDAHKNIVIHPPTDPSRRAWCDTGEPIILPARPYMDRNRDIVDACERLVAAPSGPERTRSGTWATIRYAISTGTPVLIVWPNGTFEKRESQ